jgi:hypothetical protein
MTGIQTSRVYDFAMPKYICVLVPNKPDTIRIEADKAEFEEPSPQRPPAACLLTATKNGEKVAQFVLGNIAGWWFEDIEIKF